MGAAGVPTGRGAMAPAGTPRGATVLAVMGRSRTGRDSGRAGTERGSGRAGTGRGSTVRGVARRTTAPGTARALTGPVPMAHDASSPVPPVHAAGRNHGRDRGRAMTEAVRVAQVAQAARAGRMPGGPRVLGPIAVVRGPDRAIDSDRVRGCGHGIAARTIGANRPVPNPGARTTDGPAWIGATETDRGSPPVIAQATDAAGEGRPGGDRSEAHPALAARPRIDRIASAPKAGIRTNGRRSTAPTGARHGRQRCHPRRRSAMTRNLSRAGVRSKRRSSLGARPSVSWWCRSDGPRSRRSCSMPRTCGSRSSRSKGAR